MEPKQIAAMPLTAEIAVTPGALGGRDHPRAAQRCRAAAAVQFLYFYAPGAPLRRERRLVRQKAQAYRSGRDDERGDGSFGWEVARANARRQ